MRFSGNDFMVLGMCLAMAGSFIMAKGILSKDMFLTLKESGTYFNQNMFQVKGSIFQKHEAIIGGLYLFVGFLLNLIGIFVGVKNKNESDVFLYSYWNIVCFLMFTFLLIWAGLSISNKISQSHYTPLVKTGEHLNTLKWAIFILENEGWYQEDYPKKGQLNMSKEVLGGHITQANDIFTNMGLWVDIRRSQEESDTVFASRVLDYYSK